MSELAISITEQTNEEKVSSLNTEEKVETKATDDAKTNADVVTNSKTPNETDAKTATKDEKKAPAKKRQRQSRAELIKRNANPTTHLVSVQKTIKLPLNYTSDILHYYLQPNQQIMLSAYERLAGLKRMLSRDVELLTHVDEWVSENISICQAQLEEITAQREALADGFDIPEMNIPESYRTEFIASHPIAHKMIVIAEMVDEELSEVEELFFAGAIDDAQYASLREQAMVIVRGSVDRIFKATSPGSRKNGRYTPQELARWIREGNRLEMPDVPLVAQNNKGEEEAAKQEVEVIKE